MRRIETAVLAAAVLVFAGCNSGSGDAVTIGGMGPLSGDNAQFGQEARNGAQLAVDEINAAGGLLGKTLNLVYEDDQSDPALAINVFRKLTSQDKIGFLIGGVTSGATLAITEQAQAQKVVVIAPSATHADVTKAGDFIFRACFIDPFQGVVGANFAWGDLGARRAAVLYNQSNDYAVGLYENFESTFQARGGAVLAEAYNEGEIDFSAQITRIRAFNPAVIYLPQYYGAVGLQATQIRAQGITVPLLGGDGWDGLTAEAQDQAALNGFFSNHYASDATDPAVVEFVTKYRAKHGNDPLSFAALGYDCMYLLRDAILRAGSFDTTAVKDALAATDGDYVTGHLTFDANRNPVKSAAILEVVQAPAGGLTTVYRATVNP
ncbi:MAG: ABC transporter substrate-binding protein [Spirochaetaceae bacterium]|jgi:branched-chain amino acid transport system substrate-binding protein|nr:ABC transporter substrate-binding protein [Spirochaetaceae bacterium]